MFGSTWLKTVIEKRIIVHTKEDQSIEGSLAAVMKDGLVLRVAALLGSSGQSTAMPGEVFIPREEVAFVQHAE